MKVPHKVAFFIWTAARGKILTMDNLHMINICFVEWRCMCKKSSEFVDHLFLVELFTEHVIDPCINFSCSNGLS